MLSIILRYFEDLEAVPDAYREGEDDHDIGKHDNNLAKNIERKFKRRKRDLCSKKVKEVVLTFASLLSSSPLVGYPPVPRTITVPSGER